MADFNDNSHQREFIHAIKYRIDEVEKNSLITS